MLHPKQSAVKPFLKWAGGKTQLLPVLAAAFPQHFKSGAPFTYIEPFVGSGAVLFWVLNNFPQVGRVVINDINADLTAAYQTIKDNPSGLIRLLQELERDFLDRKEADRKEFYLEKRDLFNQRHLGQLEMTSLLIFLNRTCFNGLYRVNSQNKFNVPFGKYKQPTICNAPLLEAVSAALQKVVVLNGDFEKNLSYARGETFFYFDPPYKPISQTSSFNAYAHETFDDSSQKRLKSFCDQLDSLGHKWLLSNSDPKNIDPENSFFDDLYQPYFIRRVKARRAINSKVDSRGEIHELLISNYPQEH